MIWLFLLIWTVASVVIFARSIGYKTGGGPWYINGIAGYIVLAPALIIATILGFILRCIEWVGSKKSA